MLPDNCAVTVLKDSTYSVSIHDGFLTEVQTPWMTGPFGRPIQLDENLQVIADDIPLESACVEGFTTSLIWQNENLKIKRLINKHPYWPCPVIQFELTNLNNSTHDISITWQLNHTSQFTCLHLEQSRDRSTFDFTNESTNFPLFFHKIHEVRPSHTQFIFRFQLKPGEEKTLICPLWFIRSKYETRFSGFVFLVGSEDIKAGVSALACRMDDTFDDQVIQVLSRRFSPIFWTKDSIPEDVWRFIELAPIKIVISLSAISSHCKRRLETKGITLIEVDPHTPYLERALQDTVDRLLSITRQKQIVTIVPPKPEFMICGALIASSHGYQMLIEDANLNEELKHVSPSFVGICKEKGHVAPTAIIQDLTTQRIPHTIYYEDRVSLFEGTANALTTFGSEANIQLDALLDPTDANKRFLEELFKATDEGASPEDVFFLVRPFVNAPPLFVVASYDPNHLNSAISAANYAKSKNATLFLLPDPSLPVKERLRLLLTELGDFLREETAEVWYALLRLLCCKAIMEGEDLRVLRLSNSEVTGDISTVPFMSVDEARCWLGQHFPEDIEFLRVQSFVPLQLENQIREFRRNYLGLIPPSLMERLPKGSLAPFEGVVTSLLYQIGHELRSEIPDLLFMAFISTAKKSLLYFPSDPIVPLELLLLPDESSLSTLHSSCPFGRTVSNHPNDAPLQCGYTVLHTSQNPGFLSGLMIADPTCDLDASRAEAEALSNTPVFSWTRLLGEEANKGAVVQALQAAKLIYFTCHGAWDEEGEPYLQMNDGRLYGDDLPDMKGQPLVIANACLSGADQGYVSGGSLALDFISKGALAYIGSTWRIDSAKAATMGVGLLDGILEKPIGTALFTTRSTKMLGDFTALSYVLYGDPTVPIFEPLTFAVEAYYYARSSEYFLRNGQLEIAEILNRKAAACFNAMRIEFLARSECDRGNSASWEMAARNASHVQQQLLAEYHILRFNLADTNQEKIDELRSAMTALAEGEKRFPETLWFRGRRNGLLGIQSLMRGNSLIESGAQAADEACKEFEQAIYCFSQAIKEEFGDRNKTVFLAHTNEAKGLINLCKGLQDFKRTREAYECLVESADNFREGSIRSADLSLKRRLFRLQALPIELLIQWDTDMLTHLDNELVSNRISRSQYEEGKIMINKRMEQYREVIKETQSEGEA